MILNLFLRILNVELLIPLKLKFLIMKSIISSLTILCISINLFAQSVSVFNEKQKYNRIESTRFHPKANTAWLVDSLYDFDAYNSPYPEWHSLTKDLVTERTSNGLPLIFMQYRYWYSSNTEDTVYIMQYEYPNINDSLHYSFISANKGFITHEWENFRKNIYTVENEYESIIEQKLVDDSWTNQEKILSRGDSIDFIEIQLKWNESTNLWENERKYRRFYNSDFSEYTFTKEVYAANNWVIKYSSKTYFNASGLDTLQIEKKKVNDALINDKKVKSIYDTEDYLSSSITYRWNQELNRWENERRYDYGYDSNRNSNLKIHYLPYQDTLWIPNYIEESLYNSSNQDTSMIRSFYNIDEDNYTPSLKYSKEYESDLLSFSKLWSWNDSVWNLIQVRAYEYDWLDRILYDNTNGIFDGTLYPKDKNEYRYTDLTTHQSREWHRQTYNRIDSIWMNYEKNIEFKNLHITEIEELPVNTFRLFPNPALNYINIDSDIYFSQHNSYEILDIQGKVINYGKLLPSGQVNVSYLQRGVYFIRIYIPSNKAITLEFVKN